MKKGQFYTVPDSPPSLDLPVVFMAGPVQGAADHQRDVADVIFDHTNEVNILSPRGNYASKAEFEYDTQVAWEEEHLALARDQGILSFNFATRDPSVPYDTSRSFAKTSRLEIMKAFGWMDYDPSITLAVRIDPDYVGENTRYIERELRIREIPIQRGTNKEYGEYIVSLLQANHYIK